MISASDINLYHCSVALFEEICVTVNKSVVFMDDAFAEVFHWHGGATTLFNAGVLDVREFSSFESGDANQKKAVFFISSPLENLNLEILKDIISASSFQNIIVVSNISPAMHSLIEFRQSDDETKAFGMYKKQILNWMEEKIDDCFADFLYFPMVIAPILPSLFVLPAHANVFPLLPTDLHLLRVRHKLDSRAGSGATDVDFTHLPKELQLRLKLLSCSLNSMLEVFSCSEEIFAVGATSNIVASELANLSWSKARKKNAQRKASLLVVDRTLDLASAVGHFQDSLLDKILSVLPRLPGHNNDVVVDVVPLCSVVSNPNFSVVPPGCLAHPEDPVSTSVLNTLAVLKQKEIMMELNRNLTEAVTKEQLVPSSQSRTAKVGVEQIESNVDCFKLVTKSFSIKLPFPAKSPKKSTIIIVQHPLPQHHINKHEKLSIRANTGRMAASQQGKYANIRKHSGLLQLALAVVQSLKHPGFTAMDGLQAMEKGLLQCIGDDDTPAPLVQIMETFEKEIKLEPSQRTHTLDDMLLILVFIFSLGEDACQLTSKEETQLEMLLTEVFTEHIGSSADTIVAAELIKSQRGKNECFAIAQDVIDKLKGFSQARDNLSHYRNISEAGSVTSQARLLPLLKQILEDIVSPSKPELADVVHKSNKFGDFLKSGFGLFRVASKPRPSDHPLLIIFVIGGITCTEVRQIRDVISSAKSLMQVLVGSTTLVKPTDILKLALIQDNLHVSSAMSSK